MGNFLAHLETTTSGYPNNWGMGRMVNNWRDDSTSMWQWMGNMMGGNFGLGFGLWGFFMFLFWILVLVALVLFIRWLWNQSEGKTKDPLNILKERYARGEIDKKEYEERKSTLVD